MAAKPGQWVASEFPYYPAALAAANPQKILRIFWSPCRAHPKQKAAETTAFSWFIFSKMNAQL